MSYQLRYTLGEWARYMCSHSYAGVCLKVFFSKPYHLYRKFCEGKNVVFDGKNSVPICGQIYCTMARVDPGESGISWKIVLVRFVDGYELRGMISPCNTGSGSPAHNTHQNMNTNAPPIEIINV